MSQCLRCSKSCEATSVFCETCRSHLRSQLWQATNTLPETSVTMWPVVSKSSESVGVSADASCDPWDRITGHQPIGSVPSLPQTPPPLSPALPGAYASSQIHANDAGFTSFAAEQRLPVPQIGPAVSCESPPGSPAS